MHYAPQHANQSQAGPALAPQGHAGQNWADGFTADKGKSREWGNEFETSRGSPLQATPRTASPSVAPWQRQNVVSPGPSMYHSPMPYQPMFQQTTHQHMMHQYQPAPQRMREPTHAPPPIPQEKQATQSPDIVKAYEAELVEERQELESRADIPQDELARTAQALVDQLKEENLMKSDPKLANSEFVRLLRGLGSGDIKVQEGDQNAVGDEVVGDGAKFVNSAGADWAADFMSTEDFGKSASEAGLQQTWERGVQDNIAMRDGMGATQQRRKSVHFDEDKPMVADTHVAGAGQDWEEQLDDDDFDTELLRHFNGGPRVHETQPTIAETQQNEMWEHAETDWDEMIRQHSQPPAPEEYLFHRSNPYANGGPIVREMSPTTMGVLELEAAVQQSPRDGSAWFALGLKQQENERDDAAIRALARAVQLEPDMRSAYLALAVSYTNEARDELAMSALEKWIELGGGGVNETPGLTVQERQGRIIERLIDIARQRPDDLDPDVQVALGVLFNSSEEYHKAEDCFTAALEARPDDWVLYNRLGATLANSGRSHEAIKFYHRALALHPNFVRAQFNLGISYINLAQYRLAAQCILDAIRLQHADITEGYGEGYGEGVPSVKGVTSDALWSTLRMACLHLQRPDYVTAANNHDLSGFPLEL